MKVIACLRTNAQLKGVIDEVKAKKRLLLAKIKEGRASEASRDLDKLESDLDAVMMTYDLLDELCVA